MMRSIQLGLVAMLGMGLTTQLRLPDSPVPVTTLIAEYPKSVSLEG